MRKDGNWIESARGECDMGLRWDERMWCDKMTHKTDDELKW